MDQAVDETICQLSEGWGPVADHSGWVGFSKPWCVKNLRAVLFANSLFPLKPAITAPKL